MPTRWRSAPALAVEGVQTGDGRVMAAGSLYWDLAEPLPLRWDIEDDGGHSGAVLIGTIDLVERRPDGTIYAEGSIDDAAEAGAELVRMLGERGTMGVSVDLDDVAVEVLAVAEEGDESVDLILASGTLVAWGRPGGHALRAGAGDPDPADDPDTDMVPLYSFDTGEVVERLTRGRLRGATVVDIAAFDTARIELAGAVSEDESETSDNIDSSTEDEGDPLAASAELTAPPRAWFHLAEPEEGSDLWVEQPGGQLAVPLTITDDGQVFGHLAVWGTCHTGFPGQCVTAPRSPSGYSAFHVGAVRCAEGDTLSAGTLTVGTDHADIRAFSGDARDHYANTGLAWASVRISDGQAGPWIAGALRPGLTDDQVAVLRASTPSGDWRRFDGALDLVAVLAVNTPGFPVRREALAAAGSVVLAEQVRPSVRLGGIMAAAYEGVAPDVDALIAAGVVHRCADCEARRALATGGHVGPGAVVLSERERGLIVEAVLAGLTPELAALRALEARTGHLRGPARDDLARRIAAHRR